MNASVTSAYMVGFVAFAVCMLIAIIVSNAIRYEVNNPQDKKKRRIVFWLMGVLVPLAVFATTYFVFYTDIRVPSRAEAYMTAMCISAAAFFVLYIVVGFVLSKVFSHSKLTSWC